MNQSTHAGDDPLWQQAEAHVAATFTPLDLRIAVRATDSAALKWVAKTLGEAAPTEDLIGLVDRPLMEMTVVSGVGGAPHVPFGAERYRERDGLYVATLESGGIVVADLDHGRAATFVEQDLAHIRKAIAVDQDAPEVAGRDAGYRRASEILVASAVWRFAAYSGLVALHAAAVTRNGVSVVVRGAAEAGKSTVALAAARAGWSVVADEVVWFDPLTDPPVLRGTGAPLVASDPPGGERRVFTRADDLRFARSAPLGPVAVLRERSAGAGWWQPVSPEAARADFDNGSIPGERTQVAERVATARDRIMASGAYEMSVGNIAGIDALLQAISEHARSTKGA